MTELRKVAQLAWRKHLISEYGVEGLLVLRESIPSVGMGEPHNIMFNAGRTQGWRECLDALHTLISTEDKTPKNYDNP